MLHMPVSHKNIVNATQKDNFVNHNANIIAFLQPTNTTLNTDDVCLKQDKGRSRMKHEGRQWTS